MLDQAVDGKTEDRFRAVDTVAACQGDRRLGADRAGTADHLAGHCRRQLVDRPPEDRECQHGAAAHRINIADRIGGGDAAKVEGIIHNRHEEIRGREQHGFAIVEQPGGGVITHLVADNQAGIGWRGIAGGGEDFIEDSRGDLAAATGAVLGKADGWGHGDGWVDAISAAAMVRGSSFKNGWRVMFSGGWRVMHF